MNASRASIVGVLLAVVVGLTAGCGGGGGSLTKASDRTEPAATDHSEESSHTSEYSETDESSDSDTDTYTDSDESSSLPPGATPGLDDYDQDGEPDPTCGTQDFGAGLVLRIPCEIGTAASPPDGTVLARGSLYRLPSINPDEFSGVSGYPLLARDVDGGRVVIVVFNSDGLFALGSPELQETQVYTLTYAVSGINKLYPGGAIQVRGHTDATGSPDGNQSLSEQRAAAVKDFLVSNGIDATSVTSVGLGQTQPLLEEHNPDGSDNPDARSFNRRVEIVIRY